MHRYIFIVFIFFLLIEACAQIKPFTEGYVFSQPSFKGNMPVDEKGTPVHSGIDTFYFAIIELNEALHLTVDSIRYKEDYYPASAFKIEEKVWAAGTNKETNERIVMEAKEGRFLWRIEFAPNIKNNNSNVNTVLIKGKKNGKVFTLELKQEIELLPIEKY